MKSVHYRGPVDTLNIFEFLNENFNLEALQSLADIVMGRFGLHQDLPYNCTNVSFP